MFKVKALIATLILGSSSAAMAGPAFTLRGSAHLGVSVSAPSRVVVRDHRTPVQDTRYATVRGERYDRLVVDRYEPSCETDGRGFIDQLSRPALIGFNRSSRAVVELAPSITTFGNLQIEGAAGSMYISTIVVRFANGQSSTIGVNRSVSRGQRFTLGLDSSRQVASLVLTTDRPNAGELALTAW